MRQAVLEAARRLVATLEAENAALETFDFRQVARFVGDKRAALDALDAARMEAPADAARATEPAHRALAERLRHLAGENKRLLEQAMVVQNRVMAVLAGAATRAQAPPGYGARGVQPRPAGRDAFALVMRA